MALRSLVLSLASGGAPYSESSLKVIRMIRKGCANRPFFLIAVQEAKEEVNGKIIEQLGVYDPLPNMQNEKVVGMNFTRIQHWLDKGAIVSLPVSKLLGLAGYFPVHPKSLELAWRQRKLLLKELEELDAAKEEKSNEEKKAESE